MMQRDTSKWAVAVLVILGFVWGTELAADSHAASSGEYRDYTPSAFEDAAGRQRVLFFHAGWCSTCRSADRSFRSHADQIPAGVVLLRANFDTQRDLRQRYGVTFQHSFVLVDDRGDVVKRWAGGDIDRLVAEIDG